MKQQILLLEDDPNLGFVLQEHLETKGFAVTLMPNGEDGLEESGRRQFDLCLVDVMMPRKDGFTFTREFRRKDQATPIIFLTAKSLKEDRIQGFKIGGDDYVTKPFSMEELLLRIQAVLKRSTKGHAVGSVSDIQVIGKYKFDSDKQALVKGAKKQKLTSKESQLLEVLCAHRNTVVHRSEILKSVWGDDSYFNSRSLDVFISKLRKHLSGDSDIEIKSIHGRGFKLISP
jgi:DNA-binding response OmpR family regulator